MERLQKIISSSGICSRRKAEKLITSGKVTINGVKVLELGSKANYDDDIFVDGKKINFEPKEYYILNKPRNVISSTSDKEGRKTVIEYIDTRMSIYPIGRLDYDTTGIILLTNDGQFANLLMHPKNEVEKTYLAKLNKVFIMEDYFKLKKGILIDNELIKPRQIKIKENNQIKNVSFVQITVIEGKNHLIKNIFKELGYDVLKLTRIKYGFLSINGLKSGEYRRLSAEEIDKFMEYKK